MLWKGVFLHAYTDGWEKFNGPSLPEKKKKKKKKKKKFLQKKKKKKKKKKKVFQ